MLTIKRKIKRLSQSGFGKVAVFALFAVAIICATGSIANRPAVAESASNTVVQVEVTDSTTTDGVEIEIVSVDNSHLQSDGRATIHVRVKGATTVSLTTNGQIVEIKPGLTADDQWRELIFNVQLHDYGAHELALTATNQEANASAEKILHLTWNRPSEPGGPGPESPGAPDTGKYVEIGGLKIRVSCLWAFGFCVLAALILILVIRWRRKDNSKRPAKKRVRKPIK